MRSRRDRHVSSDSAWHTLAIDQVFARCQTDVDGLTAATAKQRFNQNRLMIERTLLGAMVRGGVGFSTFAGLLNHGQDLNAARNALLLLMVLFENVHIGNCRSETQSVFQISPFSSPILLAGTLTAFLIHMAMMYWPVGNVLLSIQPVPLPTWMVLIALSLTVLVTLETHKLSRALIFKRRKQRRDLA